MQDEMDDWMPADTAAMYKRLVEDMKKKKKRSMDTTSSTGRTFPSNPS